MRVSTDATMIDDRVMAVLQSIRGYLALRRTSASRKTCEAVGNFRSFAFVALLYAYAFQQWKSALNSTDGEEEREDGRPRVFTSKHVGDLAPHCRVQPPRPDSVPSQSRGNQTARTKITIGHYGRY